ncbi:hypothetical protein GEV33_006596 [Tenebrio molitor]|uniref:Uncharacterized protein n=1 Tax=Tenebrio molitor TaxID=7067 RepID=A0A8J6HKB5_TENMO|nr:hypothetical protein GEV33_006596 [Tenebrio molitor]
MYIRSGPNKSLNLNARCARNDKIECGTENRAFLIHSGFDLQSSRRYIQYFQQPFCDHVLNIYKCPSIQGNNVPEAKVKGPIKINRRRDRLAIQLGIGTGIVKRRINRGTSVASKYDLKTKMAALAARKCSLFSKATSRILIPTSQDSSCSRFHHSPSHTTSWRHQPGEARPGRKRAPDSGGAPPATPLFPGNQDGLPRATL